LSRFAGKTRGWLETTPGRASLEAFLMRHATDGFALEVGGEDVTYSRWFPNHVVINVTRNPLVHIQADVHRLPFREGIFDLVLCTEVLEHLHTPELALAEMQRVLKPGGKLLLTTPFAYAIHYAPTDYWRYTRHGLERLLRGWRVAEITESTSDAAALATLFHYWLFGKRGWPWKLPKILWMGCWLLLLRSYAKRGHEPKGKNLMPSGYLVTAHKNGGVVEEETVG
jgi:SAM-dependent methyltransferase